ncbi:hypothetical protein ACXVUM_13620 [Williamsia sp. SKLECPSW1]
MRDRFPDDCPTLARGGQTIGFCPSPDGMALFAWWRDTTDSHTDSEIIGAYGSYRDAVEATLRAFAASDIETAGLDPDPDEVTVEATDLERRFTAIDWMGLGF